MDRPTEPAALFYRDNYDHLVDELRKLDLLIQLRLLVTRPPDNEPAGAEGFIPLYISDQEVDRLLQPLEAVGAERPEVTAVRCQLERCQAEIDNRVNGSLERGIFLALPQLAHLFALSPFELQAVVICLAPELRRQYDKLYAYLQDDITRKRPSVDLALELLCSSEAERWAARSFFADDAPLLRLGILQTADDPQSPSGSSGLAQFLKLDPRMLNYLLGHPGLDRRLVGLIQRFDPSPGADGLWVEAAVQTSVQRLVEHHFGDREAAKRPLSFYLYGPYGIGKRNLARSLCRQLNRPLFVVDMELLLAQTNEFEQMLRLVFREGLLWQAAVYLDHAERLLEEEEKAPVLLKQAVSVIAEYGWLTFLAGEKAWSLWPHKGNFGSLRFEAIELPAAAVPLCHIVWQQALENWIPEAQATWAGHLANQFRLTPGQIEAAAEQAADRRAMEGRPLTLADLTAACRAQSNHKLSELTIKVNPRSTWSDLILPQDKVAQLRELCAQAKQRTRVFDDWGFAQKVAHGKGLSALFSGSPGTGKTMAAQVIAQELQLDLYKADLSGVVSKYIGETEKNLARIFHEAETSNAILFFDEADALFGKRTQVSDAHDRYANIETSYLLQKMEEYEGIVILATNLRQNMDEAFTRRIRFIIEFPFPDVVHRREIWRTHFPSQAPLGDDLDYDFLAGHFAIAGGNIRNIVLNAAFLAAENGQVITMDHILQGTRREFEKIGKLWTEKRVARSR